MDGKTGFYSAFDDYLAWFMQESPTTATVLGVHDHDDRLSDLSISSLDDQYRKNQQYLTQFEPFQLADDKDVAVDAALAVSMVRDSIREYEKLKFKLRMPDVYLEESIFGSYSLLLKEFAPLSERLKNLTGRLSDVPRVLEQGKANLTNPPKIWTEIAITHAKGGITFFEDTIPIIASQCPDLAGKVIESSEKAAAAMKDFLRFLQTDLKERSDGEFAIGEELLNEIVREQHMLDADADRIERTGHSLIASTREAMSEVAREIAPGRDRMEVLDELREQHPQPDELLNAYRDAMDRSRRFIIEHDLVTLPEGEWLEIHETPVFERATLPFAAYLMPGPFEKQQQGVFWVTPADQSLSDDELETRLRGQPYGKIPVTAVHEGYPGHHLQLVRGNQAATMPRKVGASTLFVEGWAFYCEEMMEQQGFLTDQACRMLRLADQLWRACRIVIDVGLHVRGMSIDDAVRMLVDVAGLERPDAVAEVHRYTQSPTQPMCYLIGKLEIMKIADEFRAKNGSEFNLKSFHDKLLSFGSLTPKLIRTMLFD
ncbi:MAG: DUF885 domain-containing protein [Armatimonadota bacterium]